MQRTQRRLKRIPRRVAGTYLTSGISQLRDAINGKYFHEPESISCTPKPSRYLSVKYCKVFDYTFMQRIHLSHPIMSLRRTSKKRVCLYAPFLLQIFVHRYISLFNVFVHLCKLYGKESNQCVFILHEILPDLGSEVSEGRCEYDMRPNYQL